MYKRKFQEIQKERPHHSTLMNFIGVVKGRKLKRDVIRRHFNNLVEKDDYKRSEKDEILEQIYQISQN